jgi:hypothetical protein
MVPVSPVICTAQIPACHLIQPVASALARDVPAIHLLESPSFLIGVEEPAMPKFVIEREIADVGSLPKEQLQAISQKSCGVLRNMGPHIQWIHSYVTDDKIYCVYIAPDEETIRQHAQQGGFPANRISQVRSMIDPTTAE